MRILYLLTRGRDALGTRLMEAQAAEHEVTVIDLSKRAMPYERIVQEMCAHDRVISW